MFCSFKRNEGDEDAYIMSLPEIRRTICETDPRVTEIHIVSGLHPGLPFRYYTDMLRAIKEERPSLQVKAFTAVEIVYYAELYGMAVREVLEEFKNAGLDAMPGGGAEIFAERVRRKVCREKADSEEWLQVHRLAHSMGIRTNATMLYGHLEEARHRVDHF